LVSDIPAGDGNIEKLFYGVGLKQVVEFLKVDDDGDDKG
jgi:hypothetical protein